MIKLFDISKKFGNRMILNDISIEFPTGGFYLLRGDSGCGKSTLLRIIAGLEKQSKGSVFLSDKEADTLPPNRRNISMVFQHAAIFSHMSIRANICFGAKRNDTAAMLRMEQLIDKLELTELQNKRPSQLSGGELKRVAIARALVPDRSIYLFDEPLTNLDPDLKKKVFEIITEYTADKTILYVTHENDLEAYSALPTYLLTQADGSLVLQPR